MPRIALLVLALASVSLRADDTENRLRVQSAMSEAREHLGRGNHGAAVAVLEKHLAHIDGNRRYLMLLRDAYKGQLTHLEKAGNGKQAALVRDRLLILEPSGGQASPPATREEPPRPPKREVRGKLEEKIADADPFSDANRVPVTGTADLVERAQRAFAAREYERAGQLYDDAERADPGSAGVSKEQWAYCKLYRVAQTINGDGIPAGEELEREVEDAVKMAPKLEGFAGKLRAKMREATLSVNVRHTPREGTGWALAETANFRVFHATTEEKAARAARLAEAARTALSRKWLGEVPANWSPRCDIYLHPTVVGYTRTTKAPAPHPGHSRIELDGGKVTGRRIDLRMDDPNIWLSTLPHETTHVVLAGHFGKHHLPRWADEGIAVLSESRERPGLHTQMLPTARREGQLFRVEILMKLDDYPDAKKVPLFYAQSISLVDFLVKKRDAVTLTRFLRDGLEGGHEEALKKHYGYASFGALEEEWLQHAFTDSVAKRSP